ncbi:MAG: AIR synthase-related protein [Pseudomonadota bacterium]
MQKAQSFIQITFKDHLFDSEAESVKKNCMKYYGIETGKVKASKLFNMGSDLSIEDLQTFAQLGLKDNILNEVSINSFYLNEEFKTYILVSKLPGVTDDEGISAQKTMCDIFNTSFDTNLQNIFTSKLYYFENALSEKNLFEISHKLLGNKLINKFEYGKLPDINNYVPKVKIESDSSVDEINLDLSNEELLRLSEQMILSLNLEEMKVIKEYFATKEVILKRKELGLSAKPTDCEIEVLAQTWSEHCKHKEFNALIEYEDSESGKTEKIDSLFKTYIKGSTDVIQSRMKEANVEWLIKVFSDNAGVVRINANDLFIWKVETHNTPSALDPYGGALTGILGVNRDAFGTGVGGGRLLFNTNVLCFGFPSYNKKLLPGQLHPKRIFAGVREGIEAGGNKSGVPTVNGSIIFDDRYAGKPLVYCGTGSILPSAYGDLNTWDKRIDVGDLIIMAGGRVGKDGIHGATFSSVEIDENSPQSAVQIGSPITQKLLCDFMEKACAKSLIKCSTDDGAGGLSSSIGELAEITNGAIVNLEKVPLKYSGLKPWEIFVSESQERMTFTCVPEKLDDMQALASEMEVEISVIGEFNDSGYLDIKYENNQVALLDLDFLHNAVPRKKMNASWKKPIVKEPEIEKNIDYNQILLCLIASENICSREDVIRQYDHEVKGKSVIKPLMGKKGKAPQDAAVIRVNHNSYEGLAISNGICPKYGDIDAYEMSCAAFDEGIRQIISVGGVLPDFENNKEIFWSVNDNFCVPDSLYHENKNPDGKYKLAQLVRMCKGLYDMSTFYNIPMTSGKDSMKNDFKIEGVKISVPPTILYSMVAKISDVRKTISSDFKAKGDLIYQLGLTYNELGASEFYKLFNMLGANVPKVRKDEALRLYKNLEKANSKSLIESSHDLSDGGLAVALCESAFGTGFGFEVSLNEQALFEEDGDLKNKFLFSESQSRFVVSIKPENKEAFEEIFSKHCFYLGRVTDDNMASIIEYGAVLINLSLDDLLRACEGGLGL